MKTVLPCSDAATSHKGHPDTSTCWLPDPPIAACYCCCMRAPPSVLADCLDAQLKLTAAASLADLSALLKRASSLSQWLYFSTSHKQQSQLACSSQLTAQLQALQRDLSHSIHMQSAFAPILYRGVPCWGSLLGHGRFLLNMLHSRVVNDRQSLPPIAHLQSLVAKLSLGSACENNSCQQEPMAMYCKYMDSC